MRAALGIAAMTWAVSAWSDGWALVAYLDGRGDMAPEAAAHEALLRAAPGTLPLGLQVVAADGAGEMRAARWWRPGEARGETRTTAAPAEAHASAEGIAQFVAWAAGLWPERNLALALMGHGLPADAGHAAAQAAPRLLAASTGGGLTADEFAAAVRAGLEQAGRASIQLLILEACYGASLEILGALGDSCEHVLAAPGEVPSPGLPWREMLETIAAHDGAEARQMAQALGQAARHAQAPGPIPWSLTVCDPARMAQVEAALSAMSAAALADIASATAGAHWARGRAARGERLRQLSDAGELAYGIAAHARTEELAAAARAFRDALDELIIERARLGRETGEGAGKRAGVTVFMPSGLTRTVEGYVAGSRVARASGYGEFLEAYLQYCWSLLPGLRSDTLPAGAPAG